MQNIADDVKHYAFSNCFEIASRSKPYEKVVFGQNQIYVLEAIRAEGTSPWYTCAHDEFALCMDGEVDIHLVKLDAEQVVPDAEHNGAVLVKGEPKGAKMGWMKHRGAATRRCCRRTPPTSSAPPGRRCWCSRPARATCRSSAGPRSARPPEPRRCPTEHRRSP